MAISEDTAALVAAQLTETWASMFKQREAAHGLSSDEITDLVEKAYAHFKEVAQEPERNPRVRDV
ncbi:hypothetical protein [Novosphingobium sp. ST904]|uniref:hypothetical protein n=1 Tax=Novosphingobium sp. ST904 TaxID=1684385 RepID=UPI0006C8B628|nr:hypothetical protein [Novosphingobium sp. ST904]KPH66882.1 hypothetical protein ADT71_03760 [Novosphingobium sp. ST904]TCM39123.1 hypothetical protein EDF59_1062 [Novosphingobium sp. ST904]